jgi:hypothetical protein
MWWMQINTCNGFYCDQFTPNSAAKPKMWTENWSGWFLSFGGAVPYRPVEDLAFAVARFYQRGGTFQNYYMVITFFFFPFFFCTLHCTVRSSAAVPALLHTTKKAGAVRAGIDAASRRPCWSISNSGSYRRSTMEGPT